MSGFTYSINFRAVQESSMAKTLAILERIDKRIETLNYDVNKFGTNLTNAGQRGQRAFTGMTTSVNGLIARLGIATGLIGSLRNAAQAEGIEQSISFASGSSELGVKNIDFLKRKSDELGISYLSAAEGYKTLSASMRNTKIANHTNDLFTSVSEAATVLRLTPDQVKGSYLALSQMVSKGEVTAEELYGQLAERIPDAVGIFARGMGMTTSQLGDAMRENKIGLEGIVSFGKQLHREFGSEVPKAAQSASAYFNRLRNSVYDLSVIVGENLLPPVVALVKDYLIPGAKWIGNHIGLVSELAFTVGSAWLVYKTWTFWIGASTIATRGLAFAQLLFAGSLGRATAMAMASTLVQKGLTGAMAAFNAVLRANPIGIVITALFALGNAFMYAFNHSRNFRGWLEGTFRWFHALGGIIAELAPAIMNVMSFNPVLMAKGVAQASTVLSTAGERLGAAYNQGWNRGVNKFDKKQSAKTDAVSDAFAPIDPNKDLNTDKNLKENINAITGGGSQSRNITINLENLVRELTIQAQTVDKGVDQVVDLVKRKLLQTLNTANQIQ